MPTKKKTKPTVLIDLRKELLIQVNGKNEKDHTISWDVLKKIGDSTQNLIYKLALFSTEDAPPEESLHLIFVGLHEGSAVPDWRLPKAPNTLYTVDKFYNRLNQDFSLVVASVNDGNFQKVADSYSSPVAKNAIVEAVYDFTNSAGTKPVQVVKKAAPGAKVRYLPLAKIRPMSLKIKNMLHVKVLPDLIIDTREEVDAVGKFKLKTGKDGRKTKKDLHLYTEKETVLSLRYDSIETDSRIYLLNGEVLFSITEDKKNHVSIENQMLDIYAYGKTMAEAKENLFEQFDFTYRRLHNYPSSKLSPHLQKAKNYMNLIVGKINEK